MSLAELFNSIPDSRRKDGIRYPLPSFLWMLFLSICSGYTSSRQIKSFMRAHAAFFIAEFGLKHGLPSHVTINAILKVTDKEKVKECFNRWAAVRSLAPFDWVSGDGQCLRSTVSSPQDSSQDFVSLVSWFVQKTGTVYMMEDYRSKKDNEAEVIRYMLSNLKDKGVIFTLDALHCQKKHPSRS
jgi:hypothetical protein